MKVYLLYSIHSSDFMGVFSSEEKAYEYFEKEGHESYDRSFVEEVEVDHP